MIRHIGVLVIYKINILNLEYYKHFSFYEFYFKIIMCFFDNSYLLCVIFLKKRYLWEKCVKILFTHDTLRVLVNSTVEENLLKTFHY
jgi:hypothetical protein